MIKNKFDTFLFNDYVLNSVSVCLSLSASLINLNMGNKAS